MPRKVSRGFTLLEMITVIVLLGVVSVGIGSVIRLGSQIYVDATTRDELISSARFVVERFNREIRAALPNSVNVISPTAGRQCVNFIPAYASAIYRDIPVLPEAATDSIDVIRFDDQNYSDDLFVVPYPLDSSSLYLGGSSVPVSIAGSSRPDNSVLWNIELSSATQFLNESPTARIYFVGHPIMYCVHNGELRRYAKNNFSSNFSFSLQGILMAEDLEEVDLVNAPPFHINEATRLRNAILTTEFRFEKNDENIVLHNEIQVMNAP